MQYLLYITTERAFECNQSKVKNETETPRQLGHMSCTLTGMSQSATSMCVQDWEVILFFFLFFYIHYTASQTSGRLSYVMLESEIHNIARGKGLGIWEKYVLVAVPASELFFITTWTPTLNKRSRFHNSTLDFPSTPLANRRINVPWKPRISRPNRSGTNIPFTDSLKKIYDLPKPRRGLKPTAYTFP